MKKINKHHLLPSTDDAMTGLRPIAGGQEDLTLRTLEEAYRRIAEDGRTESAYVSHDGEVCGVGAILAADGYDAEILDGESIQELLGWQDPPLGGSPLQIACGVEARVSVAAREAIKLVNEAVLELHSNKAWEEEARRSRFYGPIEWLNQDWYPEMDEVGVNDVNHDYDDSFEARTVAVLGAYKHAIDKRRGALVA